MDPRNSESSSQRRPEVAPCGVFCGACPSFGKSCLGCSSDDTSQKRTSKFSCKIRNCCYDERRLDYCAFCEEFPCSTVKKKLIKSHTGDPSFTYRHTIVADMENLRTYGVDEFIAHKNTEHTCPHCGGRIVFYTYRCVQCGRPAFGACI